MIEPNPLPHSVTASASPRPAKNRLVTAAVHTLGKIVTLISASNTHNPCHDRIDGPDVLSNAVNRHNMIAPGIPMRRGPNRSIKPPTSGAISTVATPAIVWPEAIAARLQPNAVCSGCMNTPSE